MTFWPGDSSNVFDSRYITWSLQRLREVLQHRSERTAGAYHCTQEVRHIPAFPPPVWPGCWLLRTPDPSSIFATAPPTVTMYKIHCYYWYRTPPTNSHRVTTESGPTAHTVIHSAETKGKRVCAASAPTDNPRASAEIVRRALASAARPRGP